MVTLKIPYHSFIDVITNSSTEIYVQCKGKTKDAMFSLIDTLLEVAGSDKKAKDLFTIEMTKDCHYYDKDGNDLDEELLDVPISFDDDGNRTDDYEEEDEYENHTLVLKAKGDSKVAINITEQLATIFQMDAQHD